MDVFLGHSVYSHLCIFHSLHFLDSDKNGPFSIYFPLLMYLDQVIKKIRHDKTFTKSSNICYTKRHITVHVECNSVK